MEFSFNIDSSQAPEDVFSLLNNLVASGTANTDEIENAEFSGLPPESYVPCFPTRHADAQQPSLVNGEIIGRESQAWNPYSTLPPLTICPSALTTEEPSSDDVALQSSTGPATEDENYAQELQLLLMADLGTMYNVCNPYSDQLHLHIGGSNQPSNEIVRGVSENHFMEVGFMFPICNPYSDRLPLPICDSNVRSSEIVGSVSKNHFMEVGAMSQVCNPYSDWVPLSICDSSERSSEIVLGVSENHYGAGKSQQIDYPSGATTDEPSSEAIAHTNSAVLAIENGQSTSISQPILPSYLEMMANPLAFPAVGCPPSTSYCPLGLEFRQNDIVHSGPLDHSSTSIRKLKEYYCMEDPKRILKNQGELHENINFRYQEVDHGKKRKKPNDGSRRCGCKKSKCLQRYCECFSSGLFCDETCGCKGCNNIFEQERLVLNKRIEIERRNSFAFARKIVPLHHEDSELPGIRLSGRNKRHRRGCSCTKSKCLQNYCECYQANVKCSVTCCCKGCENMDTHEHDVGPVNFMIGEAMNNNVNAHGLHRNGGEMLPQAEAGNNIIGRQSRLSSISSVLSLQQWLPRESTSFGNSLSSYPTFGPQPLSPLNFYEVPANHNSTPLILSDSRFLVGVNSPDRKRVPPPRFPIPEAGSGMSTPSLPPLISSNR